MKDDLIFDLEYAYWFNLLNERVYRLLDLLLNAVQLVGGSAAALAALGQHDRALVWTGMVLAVAAALTVLVKPGERACVHMMFKARCAKLRAEPDARALAEIQADGPAGFPAMEDVAFNAALGSLGLDSERVRLGWFSRALQAVA